MNYMVGGGEIQKHFYPTTEKTKLNQDEGGMISTAVSRTYIVIQETLT